MKRERRWRICTAVVLLALFVLMQLLCALRVQDVERSLPHAAALDNPSGVGITMEQALSFDNINKTSVGEPTGIIIGAMSIEQSQTVSVTGVGASATASTTYATPLTGVCLPFRYSYGNWFLPGVNNLASFAVIPQSLSLSLFGTDIPVGNTLNVGQEKFRICGVYQEEKGFLQKISGDGLPRIYLYNPLRMAQLPVSVLYLFDNEQGNAQFMKQQVSSIYRTSLNGKMIDYPQQIQLAHSLWYLSVLICMFFAMIVLMTYAGSQFERLHAGQNEPILSRLKHLFLGMCITAVSLTLLMFLLNNFRIPQDYLTQDNIFNLSAHIKSIESFFTSLHTIGWTNHFEWVLVTQLLALMFWSLCGIVFFVAGVLKLQRLYLR